MAEFDGYTRAAGWWRFPSLEEFQAQVDNELNSECGRAELESGSGEPRGRNLDPKSWP
jgi:hypothetical protein